MECSCNLFHFLTKSQAVRSAYCCKQKFPGGNFFFTFELKCNAKSRRFKLETVALKTTLYQSSHEFFYRAVDLISLSPPFKHFPIKLLSNYRHSNLALLKSWTKSCLVSFRNSTLTHCILLVKLKVILFPSIKILAIHNFFWKRD